MPLLDVVGNIKVNESDPERVKYLIACIRSFKFLQGHCRFVLNMEGANGGLMQRIDEELDGFDYILLSDSGTSYGDIYCSLLSMCESPFVLNFFEDHFCITDSIDTLTLLLRVMNNLNINVCKASFHQIEQISALNVFDKEICLSGTYWNMDHNNYTAYCRAYGERYFLGVNFLTTRAFALRFWNRSLGPTPHTYELAKYDENWQHRVIVPAFEICAAIDDEHGQHNSHLLARKDKKFWDIYNSTA